MALIIPNWVKRSNPALHGRREIVDSSASGDGGPNPAKPVKGIHMELIAIP